MANTVSNTIAFQGRSGAYSELASRLAYPRMRTLPTSAFEDTFAAVRDGAARFAMIPIENSVAGRVADIHRLMPDSGLCIIAEHFLRVNHHLLAPPGATLKTVRAVHSHVHALGQCGKVIAKLGLEAIVHADTAGAAAEIAAPDRLEVQQQLRRLVDEHYATRSPWRDPIRMLPTVGDLR